MESGRALDINNFFPIPIRAESGDRDVRGIVDGSGSGKEVGNEERTAVRTTFNPEPEPNGTSDLTPPAELMSVRVGLNKQPAHGCVPSTTLGPTMETTYESKDPIRELDVEQMPLQQFSNVMHLRTAVRAHFNDWRSSAFKMRLKLIEEKMGHHGYGDVLVPPPPPPTNTNLDHNIRQCDPLTFMLLSYVFLTGIGVFAVTLGMLG
jgi:hypothetical protein